MENTENKIEETSEAVKNTPEIDKAKLEEEALKMAQVQFFQLNNLLSTFKRQPNLSRKGCIRAIQYAMNANITDRHIKLTDPAEIQMAAIISEMLNPRTILQAELIKRSQKLAKETENGKEK